MEKTEEEASDTAAVASESSVDMRRLAEMIAFGVVAEGDQVHFEYKLGQFVSTLAKNGSLLYTHNPISTSMSMSMSMSTTPHFRSLPSPLPTLSSSDPQAKKSPEENNNDTHHRLLKRGGEPGTMPEEAVDRPPPPPPPPHSGHHENHPPPPPPPPPSHRTPSSDAHKNTQPRDGAPDDLRQTLAGVVPLVKRDDINSRGSDPTTPSPSGLAAKPFVEVFTSPTEWASTMAHRQNLKRGITRDNRRKQASVNGWKDCLIRGKSLQDIRSAMMRETLATTSTSRDTAEVKSPLIQNTPPHLDQTCEPLDGQTVKDRLENDDHQASVDKVSKDDPRVTNIGKPQAKADLPPMDSNDETVPSHTPAKPLVADKEDDAPQDQTQSPKAPLAESTTTTTPLKHVASETVGKPSVSQEIANSADPVEIDFNVKPSVAAQSGALPPLVPDKSEICDAAESHPASCSTHDQTLDAVKSEIQEECTVEHGNTDQESRKTTGPMDTNIPSSMDPTLEDKASMIDVAAERVKPHTTESSGSPEVPPKNGSSGGIQDTTMAAVSPNKTTNINSDANEQKETDETVAASEADRAELKEMPAPTDDSKHDTQEKLSKTVKLKRLRDLSPTPGSDSEEPSLKKKKSSVDAYGTVSHKLSIGKSGPDELAGDDAEDKVGTIEAVVVSTGDRKAHNLSKSVDSSSDSVRAVVHQKDTEDMPGIRRDSVEQTSEDGHVRSSPKESDGTPDSSAMQTSIQGCAELSEGIVPESEDEKSVSSKGVRRGRANSAVSRKNRGISELSLIHKNSYDVITDDPAAAEAAAIAAAAEQEEAVSRGRRTTRLAAGKIKQVDYKASAAAAGTRGASLSGNEMEESEDDEDLHGTSAHGRAGKRQRIVRSARVLARERVSRHRSSNIEKGDYSGSDEGAQNVAGDGFENGLSSTGSGESIGTPSSHNTKGIGVRAGYYPRKGHSSFTSGGVDHLNEKLGLLDSSEDRRLRRKTSRRVDGNGSVRSIQVEMRATDDRTDGISSRVKDRVQDSGTLNFNRNEDEGISPPGHGDDLRKYGLKTDSGKSEESSDDVNDHGMYGDLEESEDVCAEEEEDDENDDEEEDYDGQDDMRDDDGWYVKELCAIAQAVRSTGSIDPSVIMGGSSKTGPSSALKGRTQEEVAQYLENCASSIREFCVRGGSSGNECSVRLNDILSFIAAEVWRLRACIHRPVRDVTRWIRRETKMRNAIDKDRKKLKRELDENRSKMEAFMDERRHHEMKMAYANIRIRDCERALKRETRKRELTEAEIELYKARELDARERTERMKSFGTVLQDERLGEVTEEESAVASLVDGKEGDVAVERSGEKAHQMNTAGGVSSKKSGGLSGKSKECGALGGDVGCDRMEVDGEADGRVSPRKVDGFSTAMALEVRRVESLIATYEVEAESWQRAYELERVRVDRLMERKRKLEQDLYLQKPGAPASHGGGGGGATLGASAGATDRKRVEAGGRGSLPSGGRIGKARGSGDGNGCAVVARDVGKAVVAVGGGEAKDGPISRTATTNEGGAERVVDGGVGVGNGSSSGGTADMDAVRQGGSRRKGLPQRSAHA